MAYSRHVFLLLAGVLILGCQFIDAIPGGQLPTEIQAGEATPVPPTPVPPTPAPPPGPTATPTVTPTPTITPTPTNTPEFLEQLSTSSANERKLARHGLLIALVLPLLFFGLPWLVLEYFVVRYVQPRGIDLSKVLIKAQDNLFIEAAISMTARRTLTLASSRMSWPRVRDFVEKAVEQELIHEALQFLSLDALEQNLKLIAENFMKLPVVNELSRDFGVEVLRFNIEIRYPPETIDALKRRAEAAAGGTAFLAYAAAAHLDPDTPEARALYKIFQQTSGQVDAARNLGGGITSLVNILGGRNAASQENQEEDDETAD